MAQGDFVTVFQYKGKNYTGAELEDLIAQVEDGEGEEQALPTKWDDSMVECASYTYKDELEAFQKLLILRDVYNGEWKRGPFSPILEIKKVSLEEEFNHNFSELFNIAKKIL